MVGLSKSPVVAIIVSALAAGLLTLLGFSRAIKKGEPTGMSDSPARLGAFGFACAGALVLGVCAREHNWLSPSIAEQVQSVKNAGFSAEQARQWVAYMNVGSPDTNANASSRITTGRSGSMLFAGSDAGDCQFFKTSSYKDSQGELDSLKMQHGNYEALALKLSSLTPEEQNAILASLEPFFCAQ